MIHYKQQFLDFPSVIAHSRILVVCYYLRLCNYILDFSLKHLLREASLSTTGGGDFLEGSDILYEKSGGVPDFAQEIWGVGYFAQHMSKIFCYKNCKKAQNCNINTS